MAQREIIWSPRAKLDLFLLLEFYYERNGTKTYSRKLNSNLRKSIRLLLKYPEIGVRTDIQGLRNLVHGDYSIFYKISMDAIEIVTICYNRQDPDKLEIKG